MKSNEPDFMVYNVLSNKILPIRGSMNVHVPRGDIILSM